MKRRYILLICLLALMILAGCKTKYIPVHTERTEYRDRVRVDSIHVLDSIHVRETADTVWLTRWRVEYRDRVRIDSVHVRDSIPVPYPVEVTVEVEKKLSRWQRLQMWLGRILAIALGGGIAWWVIRRKIGV